MLIPVIRLEVYKKITSGNSITYPDEPTYIIDDFINLKITEGIEKRKDTINFSLMNHREIVDGTRTFDYPNNYDIDIKDLVKLYAYYEPMTGALEDHIILTTFVKSFDYDSTEGSATFSFICFNRTEVLLNSFMFAPYNTGQPVPYMIVDSIRKIANFNQNDIIHAYKDYTGTTSPGTKGAYDASGDSVSGQIGYVRAYKSSAYKNDGSGELLDIYASTVPSELLFPNAIFTETYKPFYDHLEELSTPKYTQDEKYGVYISWVDNGNNLHWRAKNFDVTDVVNEYEHSSISLSKDNDEVYNAVIVNCGTDPNQNGILALSFNAASMGANGAKWKYIGKTDIGEKIREAELVSGDYQVEGETIPGTNNVGHSIGSDGYPDYYPWVIQTSGTDRFGNWDYEGGTGSVSDNEEYKDYFRRVAKNIGTNRGDDVVKYAGDPIYKGKWELESGTLAYTSNQMLQINVPSLNLVKSLRVLSITHTFQNDWKTILELKEDVDYNLTQAS